MDRDTYFAAKGADFKNEDFFEVLKVHYVDVPPDGRLWLGLLAEYEVDENGDHMSERDPLRYVVALTGDTIEKPDGFLYQSQDKVKADLVYENFLSMWESTVQVSRKGSSMSAEHFFRWDE